MQYREQKTSMTTRKTIDKSSHEFCMYRRSLIIFLFVHIYGHMYLYIHAYIYVSSPYICPNFYLSLSLYQYIYQYLYLLHQHSEVEGEGVYSSKKQCNYMPGKIMHFLQLTLFISHNLTFIVLGSRDAKANQT